jgi:hypothetical protein
MSNLTDEELQTFFTLCLKAGLQADGELMVAIAGEAKKRSLRLDVTILLEAAESVEDLDFELTDSDSKLFLSSTEDPWVRPDPTRTDTSYLCAYGQSFKGYEFAESSGIDLAELTQSHKETYRATGQWTGDFVTLRCCMFYQWREAHWVGLSLALLAAIRANFKAVCLAYEREVSSADGRGRRLT